MNKKRYLYADFLQNSDYLSQQLDQRLQKCFKLVMEDEQFGKACNICVFLIK